MSRLAASFVLGFHGCDADVAHRVVNGEAQLLQSDTDYDWLGPGAYFWESDPQRAFEWAIEARGRGRVERPAVIGAVIDLGNCLDLLARESLDLVHQAYTLLVEEREAAGLPMPVNKGLAEDAGEPPLRRLDCAVIRFLHDLLQDSSVEPFDTVRGLFPEGRPLYEGAGFRERNHVQIAVCKPNAILGTFYPPQFVPGAY